LKTIYTVEDAFDLWEIIVTNRFNEYLAIEHSKSQGKAKK